MIAEQRNSNLEPVLSANISVDYPKKKGVLTNARIELMPGEILGLIGHSGSGKSTLALAILRLLAHTGARVSGHTTLLGRDLANCSESELRSIRGRVVSLVPQSPLAALNPALRIGTQLRDAWRAHSSEPWSPRSPHIKALFECAGFGSEPGILDRFPGQISVGQAQRILIVMALLHNPPLLIADEPTSALDVITQRDILELIVRLGKIHRSSILFISHDLLTVAALCDRIAILYAGNIVECGPAKQVIDFPQHAYTRKLIEAVPDWPQGNARKS